MTETTTPEQETAAPITAEDASEKVWQLMQEEAQRQPPEGTLGLLTEQVLGDDRTVGLHLKKLAERMNKALGPHFSIPAGYFLEVRVNLVPIPGQEDEAGE